MNDNFNKVKELVELYFREQLPKYAILEIRRNSYHPDDDYLYMVSARKDDGTFAVRTCWNETLQSLNFGHYALPSAEDCENIFKEYQDTHPYCEVYMYSPNAKLRLFVADTEEAAKKFCDEQHWKYEDENGFIWIIA